MQLFNQSNKFSIKIFDDCSESELSELIDLSLIENLGIETAIYNHGAFSVDTTRKLALIPDSNKIHHSHLGHVDFERLIKKEQASMTALETEVSFCKQADVSKVIFHKNLHRKAVFPSPRDFASQSLEVVGMLNAEAIVPYLENTYEDLAWMQAFFEYMLAHRTSHQFGFVLDMGHVHALSIDKSLDAWTEFALQIHREGVPLHFHLHFNDGTIDQHLPVSTQNEQLVTPSYIKHGFPSWIKSVFSSVNNALFTIESQTQHIPMSLAYLKAL